MIGFIIKKAFFDTWDNLLKFVLFNFMTMPFLILAYLGFKLVILSGLIGFVLVVIALIGLIIHQGTIAYFVRDLGDSRSITLKDYFKYLKTDFKIKLQFASSWTLFIVITLNAIKHYLTGTTLLSLIPAVLLIWFILITSIATLFFFPIKIRLEGDYKRVLKKSYMLLLDNPFTAIFIFLYSIILLLLTVPSLGLLPPGLASISCVIDTTVHLYDLKYDYLDKNPEANKKNLPWDSITYELDENIGPRSLLSMFFPWKG